MGVVDNGDGTRSVTVSGKATRFRDSSGAWRGIDLTVESHAGSAFTAKAADPAREPTIGQSSDLGVSLPLDGGGALELRHPGAARVKGEASGAQVSFPGAVGGADVVERLLVDGVEDTLRVPSAAAVPSRTDGVAYEVTVTLPSGVAARQDDGVVSLMRAGGVVGQFAGGEAVDAAGATTLITARLVRAGGGAMTVAYDVDSAWLHSAQRSFPLVLDPTTTSYFRQSTYGEPTSGPGGYDTYVDEQYPSNAMPLISVSGNGIDLNVGNNGSGRKRAYFVFTLSNLPNSQWRVVSSSLGVSTTRQTSGCASAPALSVSGAGAGPIGRYVSWNGQPSPVADATGALDSKVLGCPAQYTGYAFNTTNLAQRWFMGQPNYGLVLRSTNESAATVYTFRSGQAGDSTVPALTINYDPSCTTYQNGSSYIPVCGSMLTEYLKLGGPSGILGLPTGNEANGGDSPGPNATHGTYQAFQGGYLNGPCYGCTAVTTYDNLWRGANAYATTGPFQYASYDTQGWPTADAVGVSTRGGATTGQAQTFQYATSYAITGRSASRVSGAILSAYQNAGATQSCLGFPTAEATTSGSTTTQVFQSGTITYTGSGAATVNCLQLTKTTPVTGGPLGVGQTVPFQVSVTNPSSVASPLGTVSDTAAAGLSLLGAGLKLQVLPASGQALLAGQTAGWQDCTYSTAVVSAGSAVSCVVSADGTSWSADLSKVSLPAGQSVQFAYAATAVGPALGCGGSLNSVFLTTDTSSTSSAVNVPLVCNAGLGREPWWNFRTLATSPTGSASWNAGDGNLVVSDTDSTPITARGRLAYVIRRAYNSQASSLPAALAGTSFARNWTFTVGASDGLADGVLSGGLIVPSLSSPLSGQSSPLSVVLVNRDGSREVFTYKAPASSSATTVSVANPLNTASLPAALAALRPNAGGAIATAAGANAVCVDASYQAPPGVHTALWRYVGASSGTNCPTPGAGRLLGYVTLRPDRLRTEYDATGRVLDMIDGSGVDLRYTYDAQGQLSGLYEPQQTGCTGASSGLCRATTIAYSSTPNSGCAVPSVTGISDLTSAVCVTDVAGRRTIYGLNQARDLRVVVDPPETQNAGAGGSDHTTYDYTSYSATSTLSVGGAGEDLLTGITNARGQRFTFTYGSTALSVPQLGQWTSPWTSSSTVTTTFTPSGDLLGTHSAQVSVTNPTTNSQQELSAYTNIDPAGRVGELDEGGTGLDAIPGRAATSQQVMNRQTIFTWDGPGAASCTWVNGSATTRSSAYANDRETRPENTLCTVTRKQLGTAQDQTTDFAYTPEGMLLRRTVDPGSGQARITTTTAYVTQYASCSNAASTTCSSSVVTDGLSGAGQVSVGDRTATYQAPATLYAVTDRVQSLSARGNAASDPSSYLTTYSPANSTSVAVGAAQPASTACTARNSGVLCQVKGPHDGVTGTWNWTYDQDGQKTNAAGPRSSLAYTYNTTGALDLSGTVSTQGWLKAVTDGLGHFAAFGLDQAGNVVRTWDRNHTSGTPATFPTDATSSGTYAQTLYATSTSGLPWRYPLSSSDALGNTTSFTVDPDGNRLSTRSPRGNTTKVTYDPLDRVATRTLPADPGSSETLSYDPFGNLAQRTSFRGDVTTFGYDAGNRLTSTTIDRGNGNTRAVASTAPGCHASTAAGVDSAFPNGDTLCSASVAYDGLDHPLSRTDFSGATTTPTVDAVGRTLTVVTPRTPGVFETTRTTYDPDGDVTDVCPPRSAASGAASCSSTDPYGTHTSYDPANAVIKVTRYRGSLALVTSTTRDGEGLPSSVTSPNGATTAMTYDSANRMLTRVVPRTASTGFTWTYSYDPVGDRTSVTSPAGRITDYTYDADNRALDTISGASSTDPSWVAPASNGGSNTRTRVVYDADGNPVAGYDARAFTSSATPDPRYATWTDYDPDGRPTASYQPRYDSSDPALADPNLTGDQAAQCRTGSTPAAQPVPAATGPRLTGSTVGVCVTRYDYDPDSNRVHVTLPTSNGGDNRVLGFAYAPGGLLTLMTAPDPSQVSGSNRVNAWGYSYDAMGRRLTATPATGPTSTTSWTQDGLLASTARTSGSFYDSGFTAIPHVTSYSYDPDGRRTSTARQTNTASPAGQQVEDVTSYASDGTTSSVADAAGNTTSYSYDSDGNPVTVSSPNANSGDVSNSSRTPTRYAFTADDLLTSMVVPVSADGTSRLRRTTLGYDADGLGTSTQADYVSGDPTNGYLVTTAGAPRTTSYYPNSRPQAMTGRTGDTQTSSYDPAGHPTSMTYTPVGATSGDSMTLGYYLDGMLRTQRTSHTGGTGRSDTYSYDGSGDRTGLRDTDSSSTAVSGTATTTTGFSDAGQPTSATATLPGGTVTGAWSYDSAGRPTHGSAGAGSWNRSYGPDGNLIDQYVDSGGTNRIHYYYGMDFADRVLTSVVTAGNLTFAAQPCTNAKTTYAGVFEYGYDPANRLTCFSDPTTSHAYRYDPDGNRTRDAPAAATSSDPAQSWTYDASDAITSVTNSTASSTQSFTYAQPFGGQTSDGCISSSYDGFDRLLSVTGLATGALTGCPTGSATRAVTYRYDAAGRQVARADTSPGATDLGTTSYDYASPGSSALLHVNKTDGSDTYAALSPDDATWAASKSTPAGVGTVQTETDDGQGNAGTALDATGNVACQRRFDPWGNPRGSGPVPPGSLCEPVTGLANVTPGGPTPVQTGAIADLGYASARVDTTTGAYQFGIRTYTPNTAAFTSPDSAPTTGAGGPLAVGVDPLTRNTYNYVNGDPLNQVDPTGHYACAIRGSDDVCEGRSRSSAGHEEAQREDAGFAEQISSLKLHDLSLLEGHPKKSHGFWHSAANVLGGVADVGLHLGEDALSGKLVVDTIKGIATDGWDCLNHPGLSMACGMTALNFVPIAGEAGLAARAGITEARVVGARIGASVLARLASSVGRDVARELIRDGGEIATLEAERTAAATAVQASDAIAADAGAVSATSNRVATVSTRATSTTSSAGAVEGASRSVVAAEAGSDVASTTARLQAHVDQAVADYESGAISMSARQARAVGRNPGLEQTYRGQVIDRAVKNAVRNDSDLSHLWVSRSGEFGPDFHDIETGTWWDVTTPGQWLNHVDAYTDPFGAGIGLLTR